MFRCVSLFTLPPKSGAALLATLASLLACAAAIAQDTSGYPARAIRIIVPFPAGGTADLLPRIVGERLTARFGQPVLVENRPGAAGNIGAEAVFKADPDGYTLLSTPPSPLAINQSLYAKLAFDPAAFVPVSVIAAVPNALLAHPKVSAATVQELVAFARANPERLNYASQGSGTTSHLTAELFKSMAGVRLTHVPYKGSAPALTDLLGGQVDLMFDNLGASMQHVRAGKLKVLAVGSPRRVTVLPAVPTVAESGLPGFQAVTWFGVVAPPRTPADIASRLSGAIAEALRHPEVTKRLTDLTAEPVGSSPTEMAGFLKDEVERWRRVIVGAGVKVD
ncbi:MAG: tripartite tricarboxylate transporter substrate binding protein [Burkholderiales bacterium]|nr:tripartite tricarboxylate transporter substrate binding protein [Burkholderiales bacterium]